MALATRKIVEIDDEKCDGCGLCVPTCAEGAIQIIDGKARLVADNLCDGLGNCLGTCPQDAITIEERSAEEFDEEAVKVHLREQEETPVEPANRVHPAVKPHVGHHPGGCPGARMRELTPSKPTCERGQGSRPSMLGQWPVQLALLPPFGKLWEGTDVLIAADCVPVAVPDFHERLLAGKTLAIACPKLDEIEPYVEKLIAIFSQNDVRSVTVAMMEVPCCGGIAHAVMVALRRSGKEIPARVVTIGIGGQTLHEEPVAVGANGPARGGCAI